MDIPHIHTHTHTHTHIDKPKCMKSLHNLIFVIFPEPKLKKEMRSIIQ